MSKFHTQLRSYVMQRQQGLTWADAGRMNVEDFFSLYTVLESQDKKKGNQGKGGK